MPTQDVVTKAVIGMLAQRHIQGPFRRNVVLAGHMSPFATTLCLRPGREKLEPNFFDIGANFRKNWAGGAKVWSRVALSC